jgi:hypothetical protein
MSHPIPSTDESHSVQVILPQKQLGRRSDMWVLDMFLFPIPYYFLKSRRIIIVNISTLPVFTVTKYQPAWVVFVL